jgi:hypothetical protein
MTILYDPDHQRFVMPTEAGDALVSYRMNGDTMMLWHSEVPRALRGKGAGMKLATGVFQEIEKMGLKAKPTCSFLLRVADEDPHWRKVFDL